MTAIDLAPVIRPEPKRDRWGRYIIPDPETGKDVSWTRATTWAKTCSDTFGLTKWELRMAVLGLAKRPDLLAQAATVTDADDRDAKRLLDGVASDAKEAAGSSIRRNLGTALHSMTELIDAGADYTVPDAHRADLDAYMDTTGALEIDRDHIERIVVVPGLQVAGTFDRLVTHDGRLMVADLKTGRDLAYSWTEIAIQLALYAHAATIWDGTTGTHLPMPPVDQNEALVIHLPVGEATCTLHTVDIAAGWEMAQVCGTVRDWRKRRNLAKPLDLLTEQLEASVAKIPDGSSMPSGASSGPGNGDGTDPARSDADLEAKARAVWIASRLRNIKDAGDPKGVEAVRKFWPAGVATRAPWAAEQIDAIDALLAQVESLDAVPFPELDPTKPTPDEVIRANRDAKADAIDAERALDPRLRDIVDDGEIPSSAERADLKATVAAMTHDHKAVLQAWMTDAKLGGRPWRFAKGATRRIAAINAAAFALVLHGVDVGDDDETAARRLVELAIGLDLQPAWSLGAVLGSLTIDEAKSLTTIAARFAAGDDEVCADIGARLAAHYAALDAAPTSKGTP